ncbi:alpha/beta fold hydrolase [Streptomyces sp. NPDC001221]
MHGAGRGGRMWRRQLEALSDDFHLVAPDLPGFGGTPGPFGLTAAVGCVAGIARRLGCVHLCGHSPCCLNSQMQATVPERVRARALAVYLTIFQGGAWRWEPPYGERWPTRSAR